MREERMEVEVCKEKIVEEEICRQKNGKGKISPRGENGHRG